MDAFESHTFLVRYGEMALKGRNRREFENQLQANIAEAIGIPREMVINQRGQIVVHCPGEKQAHARTMLRRVFGIAWYAPVRTCRNDLEEIAALCVEAAVGELNAGMSFCIRGQRSSKKLSFTSMDVERVAGQAVRLASWARVNLEHPEFTIYVHSGQEGTYVHSKRFPGAGGLPVSTSGKVLCLLSGGFDSIAAAYCLAKRGAVVDFLHFHAFADEEQARRSKIMDIAQELSSWTQATSLYFASYLPFEERVWGLDERDQRYELVVFRRLMVKVAERLAKQQGYQALVVGDSLGQVASQTLENITAVDRAVGMSILRPLIGMDKLEVVRRVKQMGLYDLATTPYKDCCSLIARNPATKTKRGRVYKLEKRLGIGSLVEEMARGLPESMIDLRHGEAAKPISYPII